MKGEEMMILFTLSLFHLLTFNVMLKNGFAARIIFATS